MKNRLTTNRQFNSLPNDEILDLTKFKALNGTPNQKFVKRMEENIVGKEEKAGYHHFLLFQQFFSKGFFPRVVYARDCVVIMVYQFSTIDLGKFLRSVIDEWNIKGL